MKEEKVFPQKNWCKKKIESQSKKGDLEKKLRRNENKKKKEMGGCRGITHGKALRW